MIIQEANKEAQLREERMNFKTQYKTLHQEGTDMAEIITDLKYKMYSKRTTHKEEGLTEMCTWVREAEEEMHGDAAAAYDCILERFHGSHPLTARIVDPDGGFVHKMKCRIDACFAPRTVGWGYLSIISKFVTLCFHMFDYVKDIGKGQ